MSELKIDFTYLNGFDEIADHLELLSTSLGLSCGDNVHVNPSCSWISGGLFKGILD